MTKRLMTYLCMSSLAMSGAFAYSAVGVGLIKHHENQKPSAAQVYVLDQTGNLGTVALHEKRQKNDRIKKILLINNKSCMEGMMGCSSNTWTPSVDMQ